MDGDLIDSSKVQRTLDLARTANNQQNPDQAIALITKLGIYGDEVGFEKAWAESRLILAEAYGAKGQPVAATFFEDALDLLSHLPSVQIELQVRGHEHFGDYLCRFAKRPSLARPHYENAKSGVVQLRLEEDSARIQLKLEMIELQMDQSPELENFRNLKRVSKGYTSSEQLAAWFHHKGSASQHSQGLTFARNRGQVGEAYFKNLLDMVRMKR
jgi:hypothetical protein